MDDFPGYTSRQVLRWQAGKSVVQSNSMSDAIVDEIVDEVPVAMVYNGISHAVMLATPISLAAFALGFSLSEGILHQPGELYGMEIVPSADGIELQMTIAEARFAELKQRRRSLAGRTGCGLCGADSLAQVRHVLQPVSSHLSFPAALIAPALAQMAAKQSLQALTGGVHAAAWVLPDGQVSRVEEDVGRHNALDKLIGGLSQQDIPFDQGLVLISSRASYEMVQKAAMLGIAILVAVSAPTGMAIDLALQAGVTLVGFARDGGHVVYAHPQRLIG